MAGIEIKLYEDTTQDTEIKNELKNLMSAIDITEQNSLDKVDKIFDKLDTIDAEKKSQALQYVLKETDITVGSSGGVKLSTIAELFDKYVEQDATSWKLKMRDIKEEEALDEHQRALVEPFLNQKGSSLAYLIQRSSIEANIQAKRGYGKESGDLATITADKILGNQTKRALSGLLDWIESDLKEIDVSKLTVDDILKMKFISRGLKEKIEGSGNAAIKGLWNDEKYEIKSPYTNNYALQEKGKQAQEGASNNGNSKKETIEIGGVSHEIKRITDIKDLPQNEKGEYKRPEEPKIVYQIKIGNTEYRFFGNGRGCIVSKDQSINDTKNIIENLNKSKSIDYKSKTIDSRYHKAIQDEALPLFRELGFSTTTNGIRNELSISLSYGQKNIPVDISKYCDERGNFLAREQLKIDLKQEKDKIDQINKNQKELDKTEKFLKDKTYQAARLFKDNPKVPGTDILKTDDRKYKTFFSEFSNETIIFDKDSKINIEEGYMNFELDQTGRNKHRIKITFKELGIEPNNYIHGKSISFNKLEDNLRKTLAKKIEEIVEGL